MRTGVGPLEAWVCTHMLLRGCYAGEAAVIWPSSPPPDRWRQRQPTLRGPRGDAGVVKTTGDQRTRDWATAAVSRQGQLIRACSCMDETSDPPALAMGTPHIAVEEDLSRATAFGVRRWLLRGVVRSGVCRLIDGGAARPAAVAGISSSPQSASRCGCPRTTSFSRQRSARSESAVAARAKRDLSKGLPRPGSSSENRQLHRHEQSLCAR